MKAGDIIARLRLTVDEFKKGINGAKGEVGKFGKDFNDTAKDFKKVGGMMTAAGSAIGLGLEKAVKTAANFEQAMSRVGAVSGASEKEMKQLTEEARRLGSETSFSASEAAEGMEYLAMAGWKTGEIMAGMGGVLDMAAAGSIDLGDATNIASNIMSGFGIEAGKASDVADVLTLAFTSSNTTLHGLGETMKYAAPAANSVGWSLEEVAAAAGKLGDAGIDASMAGTALRSAITSLASPSDKAAALMERYGIEVTDADGKMRPLHDILGQMNEGFADMTDTQKAAAVETIFGTNAMSAMLTLMEDPQGLKDFTEELGNAGGTAKKIADEQMDNLNGALEELSSAFEEMQISIGNALIPALRFLAEKLNGLVTWFNNLPEGVKTAIAIFLAVSAVVLTLGGGLLLLIGFIPNIIEGFRSVQTVFGILKGGITALGKAFIWLLTNPIGWIILGIAALIAIGVLIYKNWDTIKAKTIEIWNAIVDFFAPVIEWFKEIISTFVDWISELWSTTWEAVKEVFSTVWDAIVNILQTVWDIIWGIISVAVAIIYTIIATSWEAIKAIASAIWGFIGDYVIAIWEGIKTAATVIWEAIKAYFTNLFEFYKKLFTTVWEAIKTIVTAVWETISSVARTVWDGIKSFFETVLNAIKNVFTTVWNAIKSVLLPIWESIRSVATSVFNAIKSVITSITNAIRSVLTSVWNAIKGVLTSIWNSLYSVVSGVFNRISSIISSISNRIRSIITSLGNSIRSIFTSALNSVVTVFSNLWGRIKAPIDRVVNGIKERFNKAKEFMNNLNPFKRQSPSLVDNVLAGTALIKDTYDSLSNMQITPPSIGSVSSGSMNIETVFGDGNGDGQGGGTNYNAPLVQVENMNVRDDSDVRGVSRELFNLQRNHDRAKGGR